LIQQAGIKKLKMYSGPNVKISACKGRSLMPSKVTPRVVVLGGGFGGLETALYLRSRMPDQAEIILVSDKDHFIFKPNTIYIPFGLNPNKLKFGLARPTRRRDIKFVQAKAQEIDPISKHVRLDSYDHSYDIFYDYLVVATGAGMRADAVPGLSEFAHTIWTPDEMLRLRARFERLAEQARDGRRQEVLFLAPPNNKHVGPLYEMILMLDTWLRRKKVHDNVELTFSTCEESYVQAFGPKLDELVREEFQRREIVGYNHYAVDSVEHNLVVFRNGERLPFDLLVTFPPHAASTRFNSLPVDERGFILTDTRTTEVVGYSEICAVGDTADFPIKQAQVAVRQADAAAEHLRSQILGTAPQIEFQPTGMFVMEGLDKATFAQASLHMSGNLNVTAEVHSNEADKYRTGSSPLWALGKMAVGVYLPWRFKAGNPFHSGAPWNGMDAGVKVMSGVLAR
jgi:sulfide:quinone oxidoreductase